MKLRKRPLRIPTSKPMANPTHRPGAATASTFEAAVHRELRTIGDKEELFLRATSDLSALVRALAFEQGRAYFRYVFREVFGDASTIYTTPAGPPAPQVVILYAQSILKRLARAIHYAPKLLRTYAKFALVEFQKAFPTSSNSEQIVVGSMLFLRVLCPAAINPEVLGFAPHSATSQLVGVEIAKLLQATVRNAPCPAQDPASAQFVATHHPSVAAFLSRFPQFQSPVMPRDADVDVFVSAPASATNPTLNPNPSASQPPPRSTGRLGLGFGTFMNRAESWDVPQAGARTALPSAMSWHGEDPTANAHPDGRDRGISVSMQRLHRKFSLRFWH